MIADALLYLLYCAANETVPDVQRIKSVDLGGLYKLARAHSVAAPAALALERAGVCVAEFETHLKKTLRRLFLLDHERNEIIARLEENGIWYCPLKGIVLKDIYGEPGLREMSDNDILIDASKEKQVREIMLGMGYVEDEKEDETSAHNVYLKPPSISFEMHKMLFAKLDGDDLFNYYSNDLDRILMRDGEGSCAFFFGDEDFYVFLVAHEYKHFKRCGTGIRSLLDRYVFLSKKGSVLDLSYIEDQLCKMKLDKFEKKTRDLAFKLFSAEEIPPLDAREKELLSYYLDSGTYGKLSNLYKKAIQSEGETSKSRYLRKRLFPERAFLAESVPFVKKSPLLYPVGYAWRLIRTVSSRKGLLSSELDAVNNYDWDKK